MADAPLSFACAKWDHFTITLIFTVYIALDFIWILAVKNAVPRLRFLIRLHHVATLLLLSIPLRAPEKYGLFTSWAGVVEVNTFFLIARRQIKHPFWQPLFGDLFWWTLFLRAGLQPYLLVWYTSDIHANREPLDYYIISIGCMVFMTLFNFGLLILTLKPKPKKKTT